MLEKTSAFLDLHIPGKPLLMPNPWDLGSAKMLEGMGFQALGTTSLGVALSRGLTTAGRDLLLENARDICASTEVPVSLDFENLFAHELGDVEEAVQMAGATGATGFSIEDTVGRPGSALFDREVAAQRVALAVRANQQLPSPMVVTARAEGMLHGANELDDVIHRLKAFEDAVADVLYAPYVRELKHMARIVHSVSRPVNVVMGFADPTITLAQLADIGVARVSIGAGLHRIALQSFQDCALLMRSGSFNFVGSLRPLNTLNPEFS